MTISKTKARAVVLENLAAQAMAMNWPAYLAEETRAARIATEGSPEQDSLADQSLVYLVAGDVVRELADEAATCRRFMRAEAEVAPDPRPVPEVDKQPTSDYYGTPEG